MAKVKVQQFRSSHFVTVDTDATAGAVVGENLRNADGSLYVPPSAESSSSNGIALDDVQALATAPITMAGSVAGGAFKVGWGGTTSDVPEGSRLYFTAARVLATVLSGLSTATSAVITAADTTLSAFGKLQAQISANVTAIAGKLSKSANLSDVASAPTALANLGAILQGYIDGLQMQWVSGAAVTVSSGTAYIPSLGAYLQSSAAIALSGLSLTASTWYHIYLYSNAGTPAVECVTTAPVLYYGTAYQKMGDNSRRYIGSVYAHAANTISRFVHVAGSGRVQYEQDLNTPGQQILPLGQSATEVTVSAASACPVTSRIAQCYAENTDTSNIAFLSNPDLGTPTSNILAYLRPASSLKSTVLVVDLLMNALQQITYMMQGASAAGLGITIWVRGFFYER